MSEKYMKVEVFRRRINEEKDGWVEIQFQDLKDEDRFRMFNPETGEEFRGDKGLYEWIVIGEPYQTDEGVWAVNIRE